MSSDDCEALRQKMQRDLNCLVDPDRSARRRSLQKLKKALVDQPTASEAARAEFFAVHAQTSLINQFADPVEKCREFAIGIVNAFAAMASLDVVSLAKEALPAISARIGVTPFEETAEELRLQLVELCATILRRMPAEAVADFASDLALMFARVVTDTFPDVKRACCVPIEIIAAAAPSETRRHVAALLKPMILNLGHQHSKTRHVTLKAVGALVVCGSDDLPKIMKDQLLPTLKNLLQDRAASVRQQLVLTLGTVLAHPPPPKAPTPKEEAGSDDPAQRGLSSFEPRLLSLLLSLLSDETPPVAALALKTAEEAGSVWSVARGGGSDEQASATVFDFDPAAAAATGMDAPPREAPGLQRMVCCLLGELVPIALEDSAHWTLATRHRGVLLARVLVVYAAGAIEAHVPQMLTTLCTASADEEEVVREATHACATEIGRVITGSGPPVAVAFVDALLAQAQGRVDGLDTAPHRRNALVVVSAAIGGLSAALIGTAAGDGVTPNDPMAAHAIKVASALVDRGVLEIADTPLRISMLETCGALIASAPSACGNGDDVCRPLLRTLVQLMADAELCEAATEHVAKLAELCGCANEMALYERHFAFLLESITHPDGGAISSLYQQQAFDVLMRTASSVAGPHLARVLQVFFEHAKADSDPDARLRMMALLETVLANEQCARHATPFARQLITVLIVPNTVWKAGRVAATIRKVTIACLYTLLRAERVDEETLYVTAPQLLPILKTNLDDYDASTRQLVCLSLCMIFKALPNALGEDALRELYPALLKRLDDSSDDVRRAVCDTMCAFFLTSQPRNFRGTILEYSVEQLLVHLDDHDAAIQQAVAAVLRVAITLDAATVMKKLREIRTSHRSPALCDELMAHAQGVEG